VSSSFQIDVAALRTLAQRFRDMNVIDAMREGMEIGTAKLASYIVQNKLSGQVLNIRTGNLAQSVETPSPGPTSETSVTYLVGGKYYGKFHEFGTSRLPARPWLNPSIQEQKDMIGAEVMAAIRRAMRL
jgi:HK97 gp10 family phage protein